MENLAFVARTSYDTHQNTDRTNDASNCANEWLAADSCQALPDSAFIRNQNCRQTYETALRIRMQERGKILDTICCLAKESVLTEQICQVLMVAYSRPVGC